MKSSYTVNECMMRGFPVEYEGKRFKRINAIIWRVAVGDAMLDEKAVQVELYDGESNAVIIAPASAVHLDLEDEDEEQG